MKPKGQRLHERPQQQWPRDADERVRQTVQTLRQRLGVKAPLHLHAAGEYFLVMEFPAGDVAAARAAALVLSTKLPRLWFVIDRLLVRNGRFVRRASGYRIELVQATNVRLPRLLRSAIRDLLEPTEPLPDDPPPPALARRRREAFFIAHPSRRTELKRHKRRTSTEANHAASSTGH